MDTREQKSLYLDYNSHLWGICIKRQHSVVQGMPSTLTLIVFPTLPSELFLPLLNELPEAMAGQFRAMAAIY